MSRSSPLTSGSATLHFANSSPKKTAPTPQGEELWALSTDAHLPGFGYSTEWKEYLKRRFQYSMPALELHETSAGTAAETQDTPSGTTSAPVDSSNVQVAAASVQSTPTPQTAHTLSASSSSELTSEASAAASVLPPAQGDISQAQPLQLQQSSSASEHKPSKPDISLSPQPAQTQPVAAPSFFDVIPTPVKKHSDPKDEDDEPLDTDE